MKFLPQETFPDLLVGHPAFVSYLVDGYKVKGVEAAEPGEGWSKNRYWRVILERKDARVRGVTERKTFCLVEKDGEFEEVGG